MRLQLALLPRQHRLHLRFVAGARLPGLHVQQLGVRQLRQFAMPQVRGARECLPENEGDDDQRGEEMPAPGARIEARTRAGIRSYAQFSLKRTPAYADSGEPGCRTRASAPAWFITLKVVKYSSSSRLRTSANNSSRSVL